MKGDSVQASEFLESRSWGGIDWIDFTNVAEFYYGARH
jgi:hypothetical protein